MRRLAYFLTLILTLVAALLDAGMIATLFLIAHGVR